MAAAEVDHSSTGTTVETAGTVEAVQAVVRAAIDVGRQVLDAVERAMDDPATADRLAEVVAGFTRLADGMRPGPGAQGSPADGGARDLEHIEVS